MWLMSDTGAVIFAAVVMPPGATNKPLLAVPARAKLGGLREVIMLVEFPKKKPNRRVLNEDEMKAIALMFWQATSLARRTLAEWSVRKNKPTQDELFNLTQTLFSAEEVAEEITNSPPSDGHKAIQWMKVIVEEIEQLNPVDAS
jgi:hypothetical protein